MLLATNTTYNPLKSYEWNCVNAPAPVELELEPVQGVWSYAGFKTNSPFALGAGPALNGRWALYYASLGFDVITYKTVRTRWHPCNPGPNLVRVDVQSGLAQPSITRGSRSQSWAVSFGMPSSDPGAWSADVGWTRDNLPNDKVLAVSIVGTGATMGEIASDFAKCAFLAKKAGADVIEANLSCPNVGSKLGSLFTRANDVVAVVESILSKIESTPLLLKIGPLLTYKGVAALVEALRDYPVEFVTTNCIPMSVDGFDGRRGVGGAVLRDLSLTQAKTFDLCGATVVGVGGISSLADVMSYFQAGVYAVQIASAVLSDPMVCARLRSELNQLVM